MLLRERRAERAVRDCGGGGNYRGGTVLRGEEMSLKGNILWGMYKVRENNEGKGEMFIKGRGEWAVVNVGGARGWVGMQGKGKVILLRG